jgi:hypothetical protein
VGVFCLTVPKVPSTERVSHMISKPLPTWWLGNATWHLTSRQSTKSLSSLPAVQNPGLCLLPHYPNQSGHTPSLDAVGPVDQLEPAKPIGNKAPCTQKWASSQRREASKVSAAQKWKTDLDLIQYNHLLPDFPSLMWSAEIGNRVVLWTTQDRDMSLPCVPCSMKSGIWCVKLLIER